MSNYEDQEDELLALTSIYDEEMINVSRVSDVCQGSICVKVDVPQPFSIAVKDREGCG